MHFLIHPFLPISPFCLFLLEPSATWIQSDSNPTECSLSFFSLFRRCYSWSKVILARLWMIQVICCCSLAGCMDTFTEGHLSLFFERSVSFFAGLPSPLLAALSPSRAAHPPKAYLGQFLPAQSFRLESPALPLTFLAALYYLQLSMTEAVACTSYRGTALSLLFFLCLLPCGLAGLHYILQKNIREESEVARSLHVFCVFVSRGFTKTWVG